GGVTHVESHLVRPRRRHSQEQRADAFEKLAGQLTIGIGSKILLSLPSRDADDFVSGLEDLVQNATLLLLDATGELVQDLPCLVGLTLLDMARKETGMHFGCSLRTDALLIQFPL